MLIKSLSLSLGGKTYVSIRIIIKKYFLYHIVLKPLTHSLLSRNISLILNLHALWNVDVSSVAMLLIVTTLLYFSSFSVLFLLFGGAMFLGLWSFFYEVYCGFWLWNFLGWLGFIEGFGWFFLGFFRVFHEGSYG